jgi:ribosome maturation protein SDO1
MAEGIGNTIVARIEKNGQRFEVLVDPKLGYAYKTGARKDFTNVLAFEEVFKDAMRGERQSEEHIKKAFGTTDPVEVAKKIFAQGDLQLTTDQRRKLVEEKHKQLVELIARNCIDPRTKAPHPPARIEAALAQARFGIDEFASPEEQMEKAVDAIREIIPIRIEQARVEVIVPAAFSSRSFSILKEFGLKHEEWQNDGSLKGVCEMPAGVTSQFYDRLNKLTSGQVQTKAL